jgi:hypothetical protein
MPESQFVELKQQQLKNQAAVVETALQVSNRFFDQSPLF